MSTRRLRQHLARGLHNGDRVAAVTRTTLRKDAARRDAWDSLGDIEALRGLAARIRGHTLEHLAYYVDEFSRNATQNGAFVHLARDAQEAAGQLAQIIRAGRLERAVCTKTMTAAEVGVDRVLDEQGVALLETDTGDVASRLAGERASHFTAPAMHLRRDEIARSVGGTSSVAADIVQAVRRQLRAAFGVCDLGITGANFAIAETGAICLLTNEGNGDMVTLRPRVHVALIGLEKVVPRQADLAVFLKLISRSTTGQPIGAYTTLVGGPSRAMNGEGPKEVHFILVDNGRRAMTGGPLREALQCIRCGACLNACPIYRSTGGQSFDGVHGVPLGAVLTPGVDDDARAVVAEASTLCGACQEACPVDVPLPRLLRAARSNRGVAESRRQWVRSLWSWGFHQGVSRIRRRVADWIGGGGVSRR